MVAPKTVAPVDPDVKIPAAVRAQAARADAAHAAAHPVDPNAPPPPAADDGLIKLVAPEPPKPIAPLLVGDTPPATPPAPVTPPGNPDDQTWEQKARSAEGRYAAQVRTNASLQDQIGNLTNLVETLSAAARPAPSTPAPTAPVAAEKLVTKEEIETYGADFVDVVERIAQQATSSKLEAATTEIANLKQQLGQTTKTVLASADDLSLKSMENDLGVAVPTWEQINLDDKFFAWLQLPNVYTGVKRHDELRKAWEGRKTQQVIAFFKGFLSEEAAMVPVGSEPTPSTPAPLTPPAPSKTPLENLAAPGRARTPAGGTPPPAEKPFITASEISTFYRDVNRGSYKGRDDEKNRIEALIWEAQREGRIKV